MNRRPVWRAARGAPLLAGLAALLWPAPTAAQSFNSQLVGTIHNTVDLIALAVEEGAPRKTVAHLNNALRQMMRALTHPGKGNQQARGAFAGGMIDLTSVAGNRGRPSGAGNNGGKGFAANNSGAGNVFNVSNVSNVSNLGPSNNAGNGRGAFSAGVGTAGNCAAPARGKGKLTAPTSAGSNGGSFGAGVGTAGTCARTGQAGGKPGKGGNFVAASPSNASPSNAGAGSNGTAGKGAFGGGVRLVVRPTTINTTINQTASGNGVNVATLTTGPSNRGAATQPGNLLTSKAPTATVNKKGGPGNGVAPTRGIPAGATVGNRPQGGNAIAVCKGLPSNRGANPTTGPSNVLPGGNKGGPTNLAGAKAGPSNQLPGNKKGPANTLPGGNNGGPGNVIAGAKAGPSNLLPASKPTPTNAANLTPTATQRPAPKLPPSNATAATKTGPGVNKGGSSVAPTAPRNGPSNALVTNKGGGKATVPGATIGNRTGMGVQGSFVASAPGGSPRMSAAGNRAPQAGALVGAQKKGKG